MLSPLSLFSSQLWWGGDGGFTFSDKATEARESSGKLLEITHLVGGEGSEVETSGLGSSASFPLP